MGTWIDLTGRQFGRLLVEEKAANIGDRTAWRCRCDCGESVTIIGIRLTTGHTASCGCLKRDVISSRSKTHGRSKTSEYRIWSLAIQRCHNPIHPPFPKYGGRGIIVCDRWRHSFIAFLKDMGSRPSPQHTLDRIDNNGPYSPENCRWASRREQSLNTRRNRLVSWRGQTLPIGEWAMIVGVHSRTLRARLDRLGWDVDRALSTPT